MALTKADMSERLSEEMNLDKQDAKLLVESLFVAMREGLEQGSHIKISGFGNWELRDKNERPGRNPKTGEEIPITARRVVTYKPGQKLKNRVELFEGEAEDEHSGDDL
jgi:integration host factor subunit alpha